MLTIVLIMPYKFIAGKKENNIMRNIRFLRLTIEDSLLFQID